jgi:adiponectin receptor
VNNLGNKLDLLGIVCLIWGSMVSIIYYGWYCERNIKIMYCTMVSFYSMFGSLLLNLTAQITVFGAVCAYLSANPKVRAPKWRTFRAIMFVSLGLSAVIPVIHGIRLYGLAIVNTRIAFVPWLLMEGLMYILGASVYAVSFWERA